METYHKINAPYYRHMDGPNKGKLILGKWAVEEFSYLANNEWEWTEKVDGTNIRIGYEWDAPAGSGHVWYAGRTDNASIPDPLMRHLEDAFGAGLNVHPRWNKAFNESSGVVTLYGGGYGPKIQGGGKYRTDHSFVLFDVKIGDWWLKREDVNDIAEKLGIESVPVIGEGTIHEAIDFVSGKANYSLSLANERWNRTPEPMRSTWGNFTAEGLVIRPKVALFTRRGDRIITKIKTRDF